MHPIPDDALTAFLHDVLAPGDREALASHLRECTECAARAAGLARSREILSSALDDGAPSGASESTAVRVRGILRERPPGKSRRFWMSAAAALLFLAGAWTVWMRRDGPPASGPHAVAASPGRLLSPQGGTEILLGEGARMDPALRILEEGTCLLSTTGRGFTVSAGPLSVRLSEGEVFLRRASVPPRRAAGWMREAEAAGPLRSEAVVLSGNAEVTCRGRSRLLSAGEALDEEAEEPRKVPGAECERLRESLFLLPVRHPVSQTRTLDGRRGRDACLESVTASSYQVEVRLRVLDRPSALGLSFSVDGKPTFWALDPATLTPGEHGFRACVSANWVTLSKDGTILHRVPRGEFRPNVVQGLSGIGPVVWGGQVEIVAFGIEDWE